MIILILGEQGSGKTTLVNKLVSRKVIFVTGSTEVFLTDFMSDPEIDFVVFDECTSSADEINSLSEAINHISSPNTDTVICSSVVKESDITDKNVKIVNL